MQTLSPLKIMRMVNITFIGQSSPDIRKSQKLDGPLGMTPSQLADVALKVFNNRGQQKKQEDARLKPHYLVAAVDSQSTSNLRTGEPPWGREQHA